MSELTKVVYVRLSEDVAGLVDEIAKETGLHRGRVMDTLLRERLGLPEPARRSVAEAVERHRPPAAAA